MGLGVDGPVPVSAGDTGVADLGSLLNLLNSIGGARIAAGSYVGTGAPGPVTVPLPFTPKVFVLSVLSNYGSYVMGATHCWAYGLTVEGQTANDACTHISWPENGVSWSAARAENQFNTTRDTCFWAALG